MNRALLFLFASVTLAACEVEEDVFRYDSSDAHARQVTADTLDPEEVGPAWSCKCQVDGDLSWSQRDFGENGVCGEEEDCASREWCAGKLDNVSEGGATLTCNRNHWAIEVYISDDDAVSF